MASGRWINNNKKIEEISYPERRAYATLRVIVQRLFEVGIGIETEVLIEKKTEKVLEDIHSERFDLILVDGHKISKIKRMGSKHVDVLHSKLVYL